MVANDIGQLLWARRVGGQDAWQFPQGGIHDGESPGQALFRELEEEIGLQSESVEILASTRGWLRYRLPKRFVRRGQNPVCIGQKQKWYLLRLVAASHDPGSPAHPLESASWRHASLGASSEVQEAANAQDRV